MGLSVRTAETIGMAQRGGSVVTHVRMTDGDEACAPLIPTASAQLLLAFEPGEALRVLPLLAPEGNVLTAKTALAPAGVGASGVRYDSRTLLEELARRVPRLQTVDDEAVLREVGNRRCLNTVMLAAAVGCALLPFDADDLRAAVSALVNPRFEALNQEAITVALAAVTAGEG